jgi:membrane-bound lytic murein transglycosylase F
MKKIYTILFFLIVCLNPFVGHADDDSLQKIKKHEKIRMITDNNPYCYYTYRDEKMGFEYDLAKAFSEFLGVKLEVVVPEGGDLITALNSNKGDFIAANMTITPAREEAAAFSEPYIAVQQQVIVHSENDYILDKNDLKAKDIHVCPMAIDEEHLNDLKQEFVDIKIKFHNDASPEELIRMVAEKEIEIAIVDSNVARLNRRYYPDINIAFAIAEAEDVGWAVKKEETALLNEIDGFFKSSKGETAVAEMHEQYYSKSEIFEFLDLKGFLKRFTVRFPKYEKIIKSAAKENSFDWKLIAAIIYQDSGFNPHARTYPRTEGMMQLTAETARAMAIEDRLNPEQSIMGGTKYFRHLYDNFGSVQDSERMKFALASYSVGLGHVLDAQKKAAARGLNPNAWIDIEKILPLLRHPRFYHDTGYGYCRGTEAIRFVEYVMKYYGQLTSYWFL